MKRQLNYWSKPNGMPETKLVNVSLSIEDDKFTVLFRRPGSVKPITQTIINVNSEESFDLRRAFELAGASVFQDEMDERIYLANIARQRDAARRAENRTAYIGWSVLLYIVCMMISIAIIKLSVILTLCISLFISISFGFLIRKKFYNEIKIYNKPEPSEKETKDMMLRLESEEQLIKDIKILRRINNE